MPFAEDGMGRFAPVALLEGMATPGFTPEPIWPPLRALQPQAVCSASRTMTLRPARARTMAALRPV